MLPTPLELMLPLMLLSEPRPACTVERCSVAGWAWAVEASPARKSAANTEAKGVMRMVGTPLERRSQHRHHGRAERVRCRDSRFYAGRLRRCRLCAGTLLSWTCAAQHTRVTRRSSRHDLGISWDLRLAGAV